MQHDYDRLNTIVLEMERAERILSLARTELIKLKDEKRKDLDLSASNEDNRLDALSDFIENLEDRIIDMGNLNGDLGSCARKLDSLIGYMV